MPERQLTDDELLSLFDSDADLSLLTNDEHQRLLALTQETFDQSPSVVTERDAVDALPAIGGTVAGLAGGGRALPTGAALSALGGAAGEAGRQVVRSLQGRFDQVPETVGGRLTSIGRAAAGQAGVEAVGRGVASAVTPVAQALFGVALRPSAALRKEHGLLNLVRRGFEDRVLPNRSGADRAGRLVREGAEEATEIARSRPILINLRRVLKRAGQEQTDAVNREARGAGVTPNTGAVSGQVARVLRSNPRDVTPEQLLDLRRIADEVADPAFREAQRTGGRVTSGSEASVARSMANQERQALRDFLGPKFEEVSRRTAQRVGVRQAAKEASERPGQLTNLVSAGIGTTALLDDNADIGDAAQRALLFRLLFSPSVQAATAFGLPLAGRLGVRAADITSGSRVSDQIANAFLGTPPQR